MPKFSERQAIKTNKIAPTLKSVEVSFKVNLPAAREVYVCGDFNHWSPTSLPMIRHAANGHWEKRLALAPGRYQYKFIVDGEWVHDPEAAETVPNHHGSLNSIKEVRL